MSLLMILIYVHHAVQKGPEQDIGEHLTEKSVCKQRLARSEILFPRTSRLPEDQQPEQDHGEPVEEEAVEGGKTEDAGRAPGERRHAGPRVLHDRLIVADGRLTERLDLAALVHLGSHSVTRHADDDVMVTSLRIMALERGLWKQKGVKMKSSNNQYFVDM